MRLKIQYTKKRRLLGIHPPRILSFALFIRTRISRAMRTFVAMIVMALAVTTGAADMAESSGPQARMA